MEWSIERLRADAVAIFSAAVGAVDAASAIARHVHVTGDVLEVAGKHFPLDSLRRLLVIGAGKAVVPMAQAMERLLGDRVRDGIIVATYGQAQQLEKIRVVEAAHPIPDLAGLQAAQQIAAMARQATDGDLIFFLVSGGASALLPYPSEGLTLADKQAVTQALLRSGAAIGEINTLRRHLSQIKGGKLARLAYPAQVLTLVLSDVIGDGLADIASGPTAPDPTNFADCVATLRKYRLEEKIPPAVRDILERGVRGEIGETLKAADPVFAKVHNVIVGSNRLATEAAQLCAVNLGYQSMILSNQVAGESRAVAKQHAQLLKRRMADSLERPICIISGGEPTVTVRGNGTGGRNQEFALAAALEIAGIERAVVLSAGTDGIDGPTDAAGGLVDGETIQRGNLLGYDAARFLARNDAYAYLHATGDLLITGPTQTNVMDVQLMLAG